MRNPRPAPLPETVTYGVERLMIQAALDDERLARRGRTWRSLARHVPRSRP